MPASVSPSALRGTVMATLGLHGHFEDQKETVPFVITWIDLENIMLSGISQSQKDKEGMISLI